MFCTECGQKFEGNFCPNCGTPATSKNTPNGNAETSKEITVHITYTKQLMLATTITVRQGEDRKELTRLGSGQSADIKLPAGENYLVFTSASSTHSVKFKSQSDCMFTVAINRMTGKISLICSGSDIEVLN